MRPTILTIAIAATLVTGCESIFPKCDDPSKPCPPVEPDYPPPTRFGGNTLEACTGACDHLRAIGCPEGRGSLGGRSCAVVCVNAMDLRPLPLDCWTKAPSPLDARACGSLVCQP